MKLEARTGEDAFQLDIRVEDDKVFAKVDDREYELEASEVEPGVYLLKNNGRVYQVSVSTPAAKGFQEVNVGGSNFEIDIIDPKRLRGSGSDHGHSGGHAEIKTAMPGKVVRILAGVGQAVEKGSNVIVVEAMKMQNDMKSPVDGVVKEIRVEEGSTVNAGEVLVVIE
jgi:biotin carboxyl carrier protein